MSVEPGFGGQSFIPEVLSKVRTVRKMVDAGELTILVEIDGGINADTIEQAAEAGCRLLRRRLGGLRRPGPGGRGRGITTPGRRRVTASTRMSGSACREPRRRRCAWPSNSPIRSRAATYPNPPVGAVILDADGQVVGVGGTEPAGGDHAEVLALRRAGSLAAGGIAVVTLEPCNHYGKTPPCVNALIDAGVRTVVYAVTDPNEIAAGGAARLSEAGVQVQVRRAGRRSRRPDRCASGCTSNGPGCRT